MKIIKIPFTIDKNSRFILFLFVFFFVTLLLTNLNQSDDQREKIRYHYY